MKTILKIEDLCTENDGVSILKDISLSVKKGEIVGIVGESGCGKSTLLRTLLHITEEDEKITKGRIIFDGSDITDIKSRELRNIMGSSIGVVFQNAGSSLNPLRKIGTQFVETLKSNIKISRKDALKQALSMLEKMNLHDCECILNSYPFELSGGMKQRVSIALAMIMKPQLLAADEPTSALDVTVQKQVIDEMMRLRDEFNTSILIVTHSMGVVSYMVDKIAVMYGGRIVEYGDKKSILEKPMHPYTKALISAIPKLDGVLPQGIKGSPPSFTEKVKGCSFKDRCQSAQEGCSAADVRLQLAGEERWVACPFTK